jgi:hypothetical protein
MLEDRNHPKLITNRCANTEKLTTEDGEIRPWHLWAAVRRTANCASSSPSNPLPYTPLALHVLLSVCLPGCGRGSSANGSFSVHAVHGCYKRAVHAHHMGGT